MATALSDSAVNPLVLAPAVQYPLAPPRLLHRLTMLVWVLVFAVDGYWLAVAPAGDWRPLTGVLVSVLAAGLAWRAGPLVQSGVLIWDGAFWWWEHFSRTVAGRIVVRLDVQSGLLLRFHADYGPSQWFWLDRHSNPGQWLALRRAAYGVPVFSAAPANATGNQAVTP